jgi:hypothetical protein
LAVLFLAAMHKHFFLIVAIYCMAIFVACKRNSSGQNDRLGDTRVQVSRSATDIQTIIREVQPKIKDGDLVLRADDDLQSESLRNFSQTDRTFSHCGMAFYEAGQLYVYNTMSGEENPSGKMLREPFTVFVDPARKTGFGIFRYQVSDSEIIVMHNRTKSDYANGLLFDNTFDLKSDDKLYCAEMVYKYLKSVTHNRIVLPTTTIRNFRVKDPKYNGLVLKVFEYLALDNLFLNDHCTEIIRVSYK